MKGGNDMKKKLNFNFVVVFSFLLLAGFVLAADGAGSSNIIIVSDSVEGGTNKVISFIGSILSPIFSVLLGDSKGSEFIIKILAFLMITIVIYGIGDTMKIFGENKKWLNFFLGAIVAIIGVRFMPENLLTALTAPSSAFVAVIFFGVPFIAFFFVIERITNAYVRRVGSFMYALLMLAIVIYNTAYTSDLAIKKAFESYWWVYLVFGAASVVIGLLDGTIQGIWGNIERDRYKGDISNREENLKLAEIAQLQKALANADEGDIAEIQNQIKRAQKQLKAIQKSAN
jgi:hypothetical protein